jgi:lysine-N-methylase
MTLVYPDYYPRFACLAGACPDTCCGENWEVAVDDRSLARYQTLPGALGERVRAALVKKDGETVLSFSDGRCPLLNEDGLCSLQLALGPDALCTTCREHPRFSEEYGATRELSLSVCCPEAARLLLEHEAPVLFLHETTPEPVTSWNDLDPQLYLALRKTRQYALGIVQDRTRPLADRLALLLDYAGRLQRLFDAGRYLAPAPRDPERRLAMLRRTRLQKASAAPLLAVLNNMEHMTKRFPALLDRAAREDGPDRPLTAQFENLTVYFLFRYFLKAANDGLLLERVQSCVFHVLALSRLPQDEGGLLSLVPLYSREVEHSEENQLLLRRAFSEGALSTRYLLRLLSV